MKFTVQVIENLHRDVEVEADSEAEAVELVRQQYRDGETVLGAEDYFDTVFRCNGSEYGL